MVEEANAATHKLSGEANNLASLIAYFKVDNVAARPIAVARETAQPVASPARRMMGNVARAFGGGGSAAAVAKDDWEEF
jgi:methyl-accepting chemotaxis protein